MHRHWPTRSRARSRSVCLLADNPPPSVCCCCCWCTSILLFSARSSSSSPENVIGSSESLSTVLQPLFIHLRPLHNSLSCFLPHRVHRHWPTRSRARSCSVCLLADNPPPSVCCCCCCCTSIQCPLMFNKYIYIAILEQNASETRKMERVRNPNQPTGFEFPLEDRTA